MVAALRSWHLWPSPSMSPRGSFCVFLPHSLPKPWTQLPVYKGSSSLCRPPTCQPVGGTAARVGGQCCHIPLLCKGQPRCHPVQVRATPAEARPGPWALHTLACHRMSLAVLGIWHSARLMVGAQHPAASPTPATQHWAGEDTSPPAAAPPPQPGGAPLLGAHVLPPSGDSRDRLCCPKGLFISYF